MGHLEFATWALVGVTFALFLATLAYTICAFKAYQGSKKQIEAMNNQLKAFKEQTEQIGAVTFGLDRVSGALQLIESQFKAFRQKTHQ